MPSRRLFSLRHTSPMLRGVGLLWLAACGHAVTPTLAPRPTPRLTPWTGRALGVVLAPVSAGAAPYDIAVLTTRVIGQAQSPTPDWPSVVQQASHGRAVLEAQVLPWLEVEGTPQQTARLQPAVLAARVLAAVDLALDLSRYADTSGRVRAVVIPVTAGLAGIREGENRVVPVRFAARHATQRTTVDYVILLGQPAAASRLASIARGAGSPNLGVLSAVLGIDPAALAQDALGRASLTAASTAALGWTRIQRITRSGQVLVPTTALAERAEAERVPVIYEIPMLGTGATEVVQLTAANRGELHLTRVRALPSGGSRVLFEAWITPAAQPVPFSLDSSRSPSAQDRRLFVDWDGSTAVVQVNLSSLGVERLRTLQREAAARP